VTPSPIRARAGAVALALAATLTAAALSQAQSGSSSVSGRSTLEITIRGGDRAQGFAGLSAGPGEPYVVRRELTKPVAGRVDRRRSLLYFAQLTDFQLADGESPARVEFSDPYADQGAPTSSAWRPQEEFVAHVGDMAVRQVNRFLRSPVLQGDGARATLRFAITTGDSADNQQHNETREVVTLLEGGRADPGSGSSNLADYSPACQALVATGRLDPAEAPRYTGVQDYDDSRPLLGGTGDGDFYDPDEPFGRFAAFPRYPGLMDRAQAPFQAAGLRVPSYVTFGNHDGLVQGNQAANRFFEDLAIGCVKPLTPEERPQEFDPGSLLAANARNAFVPPDPDRRFVDKAQYKRLHATGKQADAHGFSFVDPDELAASRGAAGYYAWNPAPGFRFIALDTVSEGGVAGPSADGNLDDPQFRWLEREIIRGEKEDRLVILFGHHGLTSMQEPVGVPDEAAPPCIGADQHAHDLNPGCDVDPRSSSPVHVAADLEALIHAHPHVVAFVAGHSHVNSNIPYRREGGGFWLIRTAAEIDWPQQNRMIEVMDNKDGTLSLFGTILDHESPVQAPPAGTPAGSFDVATLASIGRLLAYNDPQKGGGTGEGRRPDRNVELLVGDPRRATAAANMGGETPGGPQAGTGSPSGSGDGSRSPRARAASDGDGDGLPFTGLGIGLLVLAGALFVGAGVGLRRAGRRA